MKEIVANIDVGVIESRNNEIEIKLDAVQNSVGEATDYSRSIKNDLRDDFNRMEKNVDRVEDMVRENDTKVAEMIDKATERFDNKRDSLYNDTELKLQALEAYVICFETYVTVSKICRFSTMEQCRPIQ